MFKNSMLQAINIKRILLLIIFTALIINIYPSDRSDAAALLDKCDAASKILEIAVKNFGTDAELKKFEDAIKKIKLGKIKLAQSKYLDAKENFNEYLKLEYEIYKSLADLYIARTEKIIDDIAEDLVDYVDEKNVLTYFESASNYLNNAKNYRMKKDYEKSVISCRMAKKYVIDVYKLAGKKIPNEYQKDYADLNKKIF